MAGAREPELRLEAGIGRLAVRLDSPGMVVAAVVILAMIRYLPHS